MKLTACMPTRGRPHQAARAIQNFFGTTIGHDVEMVVVSHPDEAIEVLGELSISLIGPISREDEGNRLRPGTGSFFRRVTRGPTNVSTVNLSSIPENCACPASPGRERLQGEVPPEPSSFAERKEDNGTSKEEKTAEEIAGVPVGVQALTCPIPSPRYSGERARVRGLLLDPTLSTRDVEFQPQRLKLKLFFAECTAIEGWNIAASHATGDFLKVWDDDLWATPGWLDAAEKSYQVIGSPELAYIGLWDKHAEVPEKLFTRAIGTRKFFVEICGGVLTIPAYQSWYDDTEKFDRAKAAGCAYYCPESIIEHRHPAYGFATDATYAIGEQRHTNDAETYRTRKEKGFPNDYPCVLSGSIPC